ncbi:MAG: histidinol dehydrogenase, partial [Acidobacteria bacterium]|nr:histidinol dehydrogenase [Acidobacteriota bacterium]
VDKLVGPGNRYVTEAKTLVSRDCAIDMQAGPTKLVVIADRHARWTAADLVAQAEHDPNARSILLTTDAAFARRVARELERIAAGTIAARSLTRNGAILVARHRSQAAEIVNAVAPEHVMCDDEGMAKTISNAGTVFVGRFSAPAAGDYATGSNHVLPTSGAARFRGGLSAADFVRVTSVQRLTRDGLRAIAPAVVALARAEGLDAHAASVLMRFQK